jgi:hypothetical protein
MKRITSFAATAVQMSVFYLCTSRRGATVTVDSTSTPADTRRARCDGLVHQMVFEAPTEALVTAVTLKQGTAARALFTVWE